jgi:acyl-CoA dehydrogenase family member 9
MALSAAQLAKQKKEAEELLFSGPETLGFAKALFFGHFNSALVFPYPTMSPETQAIVDQAVAKVRKFMHERIDPAAIDRNADIPRDIIDGLGEIGVLGMTASTEFGGQGFTQLGYTKILEVIGGHCASTGVFVNAHHSIGVRALLLFGTKEQQAKWLPDLVTGRKLAAFALTEPEAGSDAGNVQTMAVPTEDGSAYVLNGEKRYITNAAIAQVLTVMARTPAPTPQNPNQTRISAFLVTPDMPGFEVTEARMDKCGIRGTATGRMRFTNMRVPKENILGPVGKGLNIALTVLDFGRTTFGAACTGAAKFCVEAAVKHVKSRVQFQQPLAEFELVKKKIAFMAAHIFAMEAATTQCASFIDRGAEDYMLETGILKIFATEHLWTIINDTIQLFGGKAYFTDQPYERMMRDARINTIGEGANEVLKAYLVAMVGSRAPGLRLDRIRKSFLKLSGWAISHLWKWTIFSPAPSIPVQSPELYDLAAMLAKQVKRFGLNLPWVFKMCRTEERFMQAQYLHERIADVAIDLYVGSCVLSRLDHMLTTGAASGSKVDFDADIEAGQHFLRIAFRRIDQNIKASYRNDDASTTKAANATLARW